MRIILLRTRAQLAAICEYRYNFIMNPFALLAFFGDIRRVRVIDPTSPLHFAHVYAEVLRGYDQYAQFNITNYPEEGGKDRRTEEAPRSSSS